MWSVQREQKTPRDLQTGKNPGTINASAYFIVLEGALCPNASAFSESIPKTGKPSSNTRSGRSRQHMNCCALSYFSAIRLRNGHKRQENHVLPWLARPMLLTSRAWLAASPPVPANSRRKRRRACHHICAS